MSVLHQKLGNYTMNLFEKHSKNIRIRHILLRRLDRYIPTEGSRLAECIRWLVILGRLGKVFGVVGGLCIIWGAAQRLIAAYTSIPPILVKSAARVSSFFLPLFMDLIMTSFGYLWQPVLVYLLIALFTKSRIWRKFWCLVGVAGFFLIFVAAFEKSTWREYHLIPLFLLQGYLFLLWLLPREVWNIIGLVISAILGLIILILPDLPTTFDDFGMFGAVLAFFLGYLNGLASLIQRAVRWL